MVWITEQSRCPICSELIGGATDLVGFSAFVQNRLDPIYLFNDAVMHRACFQGHPLAQAALQRAAESKKFAGGASRPCMCCGKQIGGVEAFYLPYLTADPLDPLFAYNYAGIHMRCFANEDFSAAFRTHVVPFISSDRWRGRGTLAFENGTPRWVYDFPHRVIRSQPK